MKFIIIGLGNFGSSLGVTLCERGHEVIGIDERESVVEEFKDKLTGTVCLNSNEEAALRSQPIKEVDAVIVAIGEDWAASIQTTALLKTMGVKRVVGRSLSHLHEIVLKGLGIEEIINPEDSAAQVIADHIISANVQQTFALSNDVLINEISIPQMFVGQTVENIDINKNFGLKLVAVKYLDKGTKLFGSSHKVWKAIYDFSKPYTFESGDHIVVCGNKQQMEKLLSLIK